MRPGSRIPFVPSAALLVRVDVVTGADLFDAGLRGGEDVDLVWRLGEAGWDVRYVPSSTVTHDGPATLRSFLERQAFYGTTAGPLARRHGDALAPVHLSGWSLAVWALALARRPVLALAALAASVALLAHRLRGLVRDPVAVAARIAGGGTARAALPALGSLTRAWSPALVLGLAFRRTRTASALALLVPALSDWASHRRHSTLCASVALHVADDAAYGAGVWAGSRGSGRSCRSSRAISWRARVWSSRTLRGELRPAPPRSAERAESTAVANGSNPTSRLPLAVLVNGAPGSGKTTLAASLAGGLDVPLVHKDHFVHGSVVHATGLWTSGGRP